MSEEPEETTSMKSRNLGFTVIELMIAVLIMSVLLAIAIPNYKENAAKARRAEGITALTTIAQNAERRYSNTFTYTNASPFAGATKIGDAQIPAVGQSYYTITYVTGGTPAGSTYTITATRTGAQLGDGCGDYSLTSTGARTVAGNDGSHTLEGCWNR